LRPAPSPPRSLDPRPPLAATDRRARERTILPHPKDHPITDVAGLVNGRTLGSFAGRDGQLVNAPRLVRTESLDKITADGAATLANTYHVNLVIDLRTPTQVAAKPDVPIPGATSVNVSMFGVDGNYPDETSCTTTSSTRAITAPPTAVP